MNIINNTRYFYLFYTIYTLFIVSVSTYDLSDAIVGILMIWIVFAAFHLGYSKNNRSYGNNQYIRNNKKWYPLSNIDSWKGYWYVLLGIANIVFAFLAARFYTGRGPLAIIRGVLTSENSYNIYQRYAKEADVSALTIGKIPYILMLVFCFSMLFWGCVGILLSEKKKRVSQYFFVLCAILGTLLFGSARGTNYELYIVFVVIVYCILKKQKRDYFKNIKWKKLLLIAIIGVCLVSAFIRTVELRGVVFTNQICQEIRFKPESFFAKTFPNFTTVALAPFAYIGWGIFVIGHTTNTIIFGSVSNFFYAITPLGFSYLSDNTIDSIIRSNMAVGTRWIPDYFSFLATFGWILFIVIVYFFGRVVKDATSNRYPVLLSRLMEILVFLEMLSIPVGNFYVSTPLVIASLYIIVWYLLERNGIRITLGLKRKKG